MTLKTAIALLLLAGIPWIGASAQQFDSPPPNAGGPLELMLSPDLFTGTLNGAIPIELPVSRNGVAPHIALQHQSGNSNGWVGVGWRLELGAIEKNPSFGTSGSCDEQNPTKACYLLSFDGARIPLIERDGLFYERQREKFFRIEKLQASNGSTWWRITDKTGTHFEFGNTSDSVLGGVTAVKWFLTKIVDRNGNFVAFSYQSDGSDVYPLRLEYTGNLNGTKPAAAVLFELEDRPDSAPKYQYGIPINTTKRLKSIETAASGTTVRVYQLEYDISAVSGRSTLRSIRVLGDDKALTVPPIQASYFEPQNNWITPQPTFTGGPPAPMSDIRLNCLPGDFNGDGRTDIACYRGIYNHWQVSISDGTRWISTNWPNAADSPTPQSNYCFAADFNGDGKTDLACQIPALPVGTWSVGLSDGHSFQSAPWPNGPTVAPPMAKQCLTGDFDGNGTADIACYIGSGVWQVALSNGHKWIGTSSWPGGPSPNGLVPDHCFAADVDGDRKAELVCTDGKGSWSIAKASGDHWTTTPWDGPTGELSTRCFVGDFNGDGLIDVVCHDDPDNKWFAGLSTGSSWKVEDWGSDLAFTAGKCAAGDFNGDGNTDLACFPSANANSQVALSTGVGFKVSPWDATTTYQNPHNCIVGDFLGDGKASINCMISNNNWTITATSIDPADAIKTIVNPVGGLTEIRYSHSTEFSNTQLPFDVPVVSTITTKSGSTDLVRQLGYGKGYYDLVNREFRGFGEVTVSDNPSDPGGNQQDYTFLQGIVTLGLPDAALGLIGKLNTLDIVSKSGTSLRKVHFTYTLGDEIPPFFNPPTAIETSTYDRAGGATVSKVTYGYDSYGNAVLEQRSTSTGAAQLTTTREFLIDDQNWIVGLPKKETKHSGDIAGAVLQSVELFYDEPISCGGHKSVFDSKTRGNLTRVVHWADHGTSPEFIFVYDALGNLVCSRDPRGMETRIEYDKEFAMLPVRTESPKRRSTEFQYYGVNAPTGRGQFGRVANFVDQNRKTTHLDYDNLGRIVAVQLPDQRYVHTSYVNIGSPTSQYIQSDYPENISTKEFLDGVGRLTSIETTGPGGRTIIRQQTFDQYGSISRFSYPYFKGSTATAFVETDFDELGRITHSKNPDGSSLSWCYDGLRGASVDENGHFKIASFDFNGQIAAVDEFDNAASNCLGALMASNPYARTEFSYDPLGRMKLVKDTRGNIIEIDWDSLGHLRNISDPDTGSRSYEYDPNGNMIATQNARGDVIEWKYDEINRVEAKYFRRSGANQKSTQVARFYYDSGTNGIGRLVRVKSKDAQSSYSYDSSGRMVSSRTRLGLHNLRFAEKYDGLDRIASITYPDRLTLNYEYDGPMVATIKTSRAALVRLEDFTALGQPLTVTTGGNVRTKYSYYEAGHAGCNKATFLLCKVSVELPKSPPYELNYDYDPKGNVTSVGEDQIQNSFTYDTFDRITKADDHSGVVSQYNYDNLGNITQSSSIGAYSYDPSKPHRLVTAGGNRFAYDSEGNVSSENDTTFAFDPENRLIRITTPAKTHSTAGFLYRHWITTTFAYDAGGNRVLTKRDRDLPYPVALFIPARRLMTVGKIYECGIFKCDGYVLDGSNVMARIHGRQSKYDYYRDLLGSLRMVSAQGTLDSRITYKPFGVPSVRSYGAHPDNLSNSFLFTGQRYDAMTGLYWYQTRNYDPMIGRYLSADTGYGHQDTPQELNRYSYVRDNPQSRRDPNGMDDDGPGDGEYVPPDDSSDGINGEPDQPVNTISYGSGSGEVTYDPLIAAEYASSFGAAPAPPILAAKAFANNNIASRYKPSESEIILSVAYGFTASRKDSRRISVGEAISFDPVSGNVSYYPLHLISTFIPPQDSMLRGATYGFEIGLGQGSMSAGYRGESQTFIFGMGPISTGKTRNYHYNGSFISFGEGGEIGNATGTTNTGQVDFFGPPEVQFNVYEPNEVLTLFLSSFKDFVWGEPTRRRFGPLH